MRINTLILSLMLTACGVDDAAQMVAEGDNLQGPRGPKGEQGEKGDKGDKGDTGDVGEAGTDGKDGVNGKDGKDGMIVSGNMWFDPITEKTWLIGGRVYDSQRVCGNGYIVPSKQELKIAYMHGLFTVANINSDYGVWAIDTAYGGKFVQVEYLSSSGEDRSAYQGSGETHLLVCLLDQ